MWEISKNRFQQDLATLVSDQNHQIRWEGQKKFAQKERQLILANGKLYYRDSAHTFSFYIAITLKAYLSKLGCFCNQKNVETKTNTN